MTLATARALPVPTEHQEQRLLFDWAWTQKVRHSQLRWLYAIPNGGQRSKAVAGKLRAEGVKRGVPDIALDHARGGYHGLRIELKRKRDGRTSDEQAAWRDNLITEGYAWHLAFGWEEAKNIILAYLALPRSTNR